jgi:ligand-binding sensor protein
LGNGQAFECHAGLLCTNALIEVNGQHVAIIAGCQFVKQGWHRDLSALATDLGLPSDDLRSAVGSVRAVPDDTLSRVCRLLERVGDTFSEIGEERLSLLSRLQHIAEVSKL